MKCCNFNDAKNSTNKRKKIEGQRITIGSLRREKNAKLKVIEPSLWWLEKKRALHREKKAFLYKINSLWFSTGSFNWKKSERIKKIYEHKKSRTHNVEKKTTACFCLAKHVSSWKSCAFIFYENGWECAAESFCVEWSIPDGSSNKRKLKKTPT